MWSAVAVTDFMHANLRGYDRHHHPVPRPVSPAAHPRRAMPTGQLVVVDSTLNTSGLAVYEGATEQTTAALPIGISSFSQHAESLRVASPRATICLV